MIVEERETNLMSLVNKFYFTSSMLNIFRTLIHPSSGACDFSIVSPHWLCVLVSMCVGVSVFMTVTVTDFENQTKHVNACSIRQSFLILCQVL